MSSPSEDQSIAELASIVRTLITEGGDTLQALLRACMASPILATVIGIILTEVVATKFKLIGADAKLVIYGLVGAMVGAEAAGTVLEALPFKFAGSATIPSLGPATVVVNEPVRIPAIPGRTGRLKDTVVSWEDFFEQVKQAGPPPVSIADGLTAAVEQYTSAKQRLAQ